MSGIRQDDYYRLLGLERGADQARIKAAFRKLARACHPDRNPGDPRAAARFRELSEAYRVLSDPKPRVDDDRGPPAREPYHPPSSSTSSFIGRLFGSARGSDLRFTLELDLEDVARGGTYRVELPRQRVCPSCNGRQSAACEACAGKGLTIRVEALALTLPAGVENGARYVLRGEGDAGSGSGAAGDLLVDVRYRKHPLLKVEGRDLVCRATLPFSRAALGCRLAVPTLDGPATLSLAPGLQPGCEIRLAGRGLPGPPDGRRGDIRVRLDLETPVGLDAESIAALEAFELGAGERAFPESARYRAAVANQVDRGRRE